MLNVNVQLMKCSSLLSVLFFAFMVNVSLAAEKDSATTHHIDTTQVRQFFNKYGFEISNENHFPLYQQIYTLKDIPYKYSGRNESSGLDCSGFTICVYDKVFNHKLSGGSRDIFSKTENIPDRKLQEGDLVFFRIKKNTISHVGIYLGNGKFAHSTVHGGIMINDLSEAYYKKYYYKATRVPLNSLSNFSE
jgi:murein DD-endopeptidase / murein LD-carboxypeptidase